LTYKSSGTARKIYINNSLVGSATNTSRWDGSGTDFVGRHASATGYWFNGYIDGLRYAGNTSGSPPTSFPFVDGAGTPTFTITPTFTNTDTPTFTNTATPTYTNTSTPTPTFTITPTFSITRTPTNTPSPSGGCITNCAGYANIYDVCPTCAYQSLSYAAHIAGFQDCTCLDTALNTTLTANVV